MARRDHRQGSGRSGGGDFGGGRSGQAYHGHGQLGARKTGENVNAPAGGDEADD